MVFTERMWQIRCAARRGPIPPAHTFAKAYVTSHPISVAARSIPLFLLLAAPLIGAGQGIISFRPDIPVLKAGMPMEMPWAGGLEAPQFASIDLDQDGVPDLFLFDRSGNRPIFLLNTGTADEPVYRPTREFDQVHPFPLLHDWALLRDYNCDGKPDIFAYTNGGFAVYRNTSNTAGLSFELASELVGSNYVPTYSPNLYISNVDLPGIADVDGDGDLDVLTYSIWGNLLEYHKNLSMELYGHCDSLVYEVRSRCWGDFQFSISSSGITLDVACPYNVPNPELPRDPNGHLVPAGADRAHSGNTILPLDLNGDGLTDLVLGDYETAHITSLVNGGSLSHAYMISADSLFPATHPAHFREFMGSFYLDIDGDGRRDLVVAPNITALSENARGVWYYRNTGTDAAPTFEFQRDDLFQGDMIDLGTGARPVLFDHNGDGLMDLVVANVGYFEPEDGTYRGSLALLENVGSAMEPAFSLVTTDYAGLSSLGLGADLHPAFGDVNGDGKPDMIVGDLAGNLRLFVNTSTGPVAQFQAVPGLINDDTGLPIDVGANATPQLFDLDGDGLVDLVVGERNGNLNHYRNTGNATAPLWHLETEQLGGVSVNDWWSTLGYSVPFLYRDAADEIILLAGSQMGGLHRYDGINGNIGGAWNKTDSIRYGLLDGERTAAVLYDLRGTGHYDLVVGNLRGGLSYWATDEASDAGSAIAVVDPTPFTVMPNPARDQVHILWRGNPPAGLHADLLDGLGRTVRTMVLRGTRADMELAGIAPGLYTIRLRTATHHWTARLAVVR